jgi:hypothetical protein
VSSVRVGPRFAIPSRTTSPFAGNDFSRVFPASIQQHPQWSRHPGGWLTRYAASRAAPPSGSWVNAAPALGNVAGMATGESGPSPMLGFGPKQAWLAVRDGDPELTMAVLGLRDLGPVAWRTGIDLVHLRDDRVILTPPLPGADGSSWLLVVGRWLAKSTVDTEGLSEILGTDVQYFATHRVTEWHRWQRSRDGRLVRSFEYLGESGEVLDWRGDPDPAERTVGLPATFEPASGSADAEAGDEAPRNILVESDEELDGMAVIVGEDDVFFVAGAWSVDPTTLDGRPAEGPLRAAAAL